MTVRSLSTTVVPRRAPPTPPQVFQKIIDNNAPIAPTIIRIQPTVTRFRPLTVAFTAKAKTAPTATKNRPTAMPMSFLLPRTGRSPVIRPVPTFAKLTRITTQRENRSDCIAWE
jgi:hypothetical protein